MSSRGPEEDGASSVGVGTGGSTPIGGRVLASLKFALDAARSSRGLVTIALLMAMTVTALEQTVVSTAMPSIIAQLKGIELYAWVLPSNLLAMTVTTPIYGKLADLFGRKRILLFGLALFAVGSMLSGLAMSMPQLIAMRVVQGLGAGAVAPVVLTMLGDLFSLEERAKVQGLFSAVWGITSLAGPAVGGLLTDHLSWRWVFFVAVPFAVVSAWILVTKVQEKPVTRVGDQARPIDWLGAGLLTLGTTGFLIAVLHGGGSRSGTFALLGVSAAVLAVFAWHERRVVDPILPIDLLKVPNIAASVAGSLMIGGILFSIDVFIPLFVQGVKGGAATDAGRMITPLFLTWACSVAVAARVVVRYGFKRTAFVGAIIIALGVLGLTMGVYRPESSGLYITGGMVLIGLGMGPTSLSYLLDVQNTVKQARRGSATGVVIFSRTMGGALGIGILGATLGVSLAARLGNQVTGESGIDVASALRPETHAKLTPDQLAHVQQALGLSLREVFLQLLAMSVICAFCALGLRGGRAKSATDAGSKGENSYHQEPTPEELALPLAAEH